MPPKKKKGKKKKPSEGDLTIDEKYKKTVEEIDALKDHLAIRKEFARRTQEASEQWKERMKRAEYSLEESTLTHRAVSADMSRQYKTMQTELSLRIQQLETELTVTKSKLERTEQDLLRTKEERDKVMKEKDLQIENLTMKVNSMSGQYEYLFNDYMDRLVEKINQAKLTWDDKSMKIQSKNKQLLLDFGLNPLCI